MRLGPGIVLLAAVTTLQAKPSIDAAWDLGKVAIDGNADEWQGSMTFLEGPQVFVGARNDDANLALCFFTRDPEVGLRSVARGLVLEIRVKGEEPLRIQFPLGLFEAGRPPKGGSVDTILFLGAGSADRRRVPVENDLGVRARVNADASSFTYEIEIPLARSGTHPYAVEARPGAEVSVTLEPPELDREAARREEGGAGAPRSGGMGGQEGERGGPGEPQGGAGGPGAGSHRGMPAEDERPTPLRPVEVKLKIRLAKP
jgi:hypothetical protein